MIEKIYSEFKDEYAACSTTKEKIACVYSFVSRFPTCKVVSKYLYTHKDSYILKRKFDDVRDIDLRSYIKKGIDSTDKFGRRQLTCACIAEALILKRHGYCTDHLFVICWKILADNQDPTKPMISLQDMELIIQYAYTAEEKPIHIWKSHTTKPMKVKDGKEKKYVLNVTKDGKFADKNHPVVYVNRDVCIKVTSKEVFEKKYIDYSKTYSENCHMFETLSHESRKTFDRYLKKFGIEFKVSGKGRPAKTLSAFEERWHITVDDWKLPLDYLCEKLYCLSRPTVSRWKKKAMEHYNIKTEKVQLTAEEKHNKKMLKIFEKARIVPQPQQKAVNPINAVIDMSPLDIFIRK